MTAIIDQQLEMIAASRSNLRMGVERRKSTVTCLPTLCGSLYYIDAFNLVQPSRRIRDRRAVVSSLERDMLLG